MSAVPQTSPLIDRHRGAAVKSNFTHPLKQNSSCGEVRLNSGFGTVSWIDPAGPGENTPDIGLLNFAGHSAARPGFEQTVFHHQVQPVVSEEPQRIVVHEARG